MVLPTEPWLEHRLLALVALTVGLAAMPKALARLPAVALVILAVMRSLLV